MTWIWVAVVGIQCASRYWMRTRMWQIRGRSEKDMEYEWISLSELVGPVSQLLFSDNLQLSKY